MKYYLDLETIASEFAETHGLIEISKAQAESMVENDPALELVTYDMSEPAFKSVRLRPSL